MSDPDITLAPGGRHGVIHARGDQVAMSSAPLVADVDRSEPSPVFEIVARSPGRAMIHWRAVDGKYSGSLDVRVTAPT